MGFKMSETAIGRAEDFVGIDGFGVDAGVVASVGSNSGVDSGLANVDTIVSIGAGIPVINGLDCLEFAFFADTGFDSSAHSGTGGELVKFLLAAGAKFDRQTTGCF